MIKLFLVHGADINSTDSYDRIPMHLAAECGHFEIFKFLLQSSSKINATDNQTQVTEYFNNQLNK